MKKILFLVNHDVVIYNCRKELVERLLKEHYRVIISSPYGERIALLKKMGCKYVPVNLDRHGMNPLDELKLLSYYMALIKKVKPDMVFSYTIKPNIYGALAAKKYHVPCVVNITGLGTALAEPGILRSALILLYKYAFRDVQTVFVQNRKDMGFFQKNRIATDRLKLLPGSGVNLEQFRLLEYPVASTIEFVFISRVMKEKGIDQYLETAKYIRGKYPNTRFHVCGFCEEAYEDILKDYEKQGIITYHGMVMDVREVLAYTHCTVHPSYYLEGISNVLLESAASGRPIITTDHSGCREVVEDGVNGFLVREKDTQALIDAVEKFLKLKNWERADMGKAGRQKVEKEFSRDLVIQAYIEEIGNVCGKQRKSSDKGGQADAVRENKKQYRKALPRGVRLCWLAYCHRVCKKRGQCNRL